MLVTMKKLSEKTGISVSYLKALKAKGEFTESKHFFKKYGKIYFDESAFFDWVKESKDDNGEFIQSERQNLDKLVSQWKKATKVNRP